MVVVVIVGVLASIDPLLILLIRSMYSKPAELPQKPVCWSLVSTWSVITPPT
jgi:hypothetical protein